MKPLDPKDLVIEVDAKCSDLIVTKFCNTEVEGRVPSFLGGGDYIRLKINAVTGQIIGWPSLNKIVEEYSPEE